MENKTPYMVYITVENDSVVVDLSCIPTELLTPIARHVPGEHLLRSLKTTFREDRESLNLVIEPKQLSLFERKPR